MATLTVRGLPAAEKEALRVRAAKNGHSMEAEIRQLIHEAVTEDLSHDESLYAAIRKHVEPLGGVALPDYPDEPLREPPTFE